jgi:hypothetical protein
MNSSRKAAIQAYKELKPARGIFAVRCQTTGNVWVDSALDLRAVENRVWFALRHGDIHTEKTLVTQFGQHGREAFTYEILETLDEDVAQLSLKDLLKERKLDWMQKLEARTLWPT